jgi:hypothetical protein
MALGLIFRAEKEEVGCFMDRRAAVGCTCDDLLLEGRRSEVTFPGWNRVSLERLEVFSLHTGVTLLSLWPAMRDVC